MAGRAVDEALGRLQSVLEPRVGKRMTQVVVSNMLRLVESGASDTAVLGAIHAALDAYARIPESGTPFPLGIAKAIADASALKLVTLSWHQARAHFALGMLDDEARAVASHADALIPSYGDDDVELAVRVAWKNSHTFRQNLVVGRALERNDARSVDWLHDAWRRQGGAHPAEGGVPVGVVRDDVGEPGVVYALGAEPPSTAVLERFHVRSLFFCPDRGDPIALDDVAGAQRFFAQVPLPITPHTLSWIVHVLRGLAPCEAVNVDDNLLVDWQPLEDEQRPALGSALLGVPAPQSETREQITVRFASRVFTYAKGELSGVSV